jgi:tRNA-modifying protein YgfZ
VGEAVAAIDPDDTAPEPDAAVAAARDRVKAVRSATMRPETTRS